MAKTYKAKTLDDTVYTIEEVVVNELEDVTVTEPRTLPFLDTEIAKATTAIAEQQAKLTALQAERTAVFNVAKTVKLKEPEPVEEPLEL